MQALFPFSRTIRPRAIVIALSLPLLLTQWAAAQDNAPFELQADRILFLGDSNTFAGHYITWLEAQLSARVTDGPKLINAGLPSETCTGLSEPAHPFPRPNVHERLQRALQKTVPDVVVVCYGMNDGIYYPFSDERFSAYQTGVRKLVQTIKQHGAKTVLLTPPPFDPQPMRRQDKLLPADAEQYAWHSAFESYDAVMERYANWIRQQTDLADRVIDIHQPMKTYLEKQRKRDADYAMSADGVHFDNAGHEVIGRAILKSWGLEPVSVSEQYLKKVHQAQTIMRDAWLTEIGHQRPGMSPGLPLNEARAKVSQLSTPSSR